MSCTEYEYVYFSPHVWLALHVVVHVFTKMSYTIGMTPKEPPSTFVLNRLFVRYFSMLFRTVELSYSKKMLNKTRKILSNILLKTPCCLELWKM